MPRRDDIVDDSPLGKTGYTPPPGETAGGPQSTVTEIKNTAQEKASEYGQKAQEQADAGIEKAASGVQKAADRLREQAATSDGVTAQVGEKAAETMEKTAGYLRERDTAEILDDLEQYVREHPMQAVAGAVVGGFLIGRILR